MLHYSVNCFEHGSSMLLWSTGRSTPSYVVSYFRELQEFSTLHMSLLIAEANISISYLFVIYFTKVSVVTFCSVETQDGWWTLKEVVKFNLRYSPATLWEKLKKNHSYNNPSLSLSLEAGSHKSTQEHLNQSAVYSTLRYQLHLAVYEMA